ncbi:Putative uncharacterized transposon-derived protein [Frankliniella fusca]|uniref:Uncharacterized transposon-derived protein n=1 Tax=Frankliniella fusca TaxID=407009 RepID=A0AAE1H9U6_9NEOP|nr:Putative uncharacterized transposon-derived protein [Frankliniella fusca]KAK3917048.1 Putative uncharacterized transposon-derived protein [Frankliniella fusca]
MENVKKFIMLPAEATDRLHQSKIVGSTGVINKLEDDMSAVLNAPMSKEEQWRRYAPLLSQWLKFLEQERKPVTIPVVGGKAEIEDDKDTYDTLRTQLQRILPRTFQQAGCTIYDTLNNSRMRQIIDWDAVGGVSIHGVPLAHSNIIDYQNGIDFLTTNNPDIKVSVVERWQLSLKIKLFKAFTKNKSYRFIGGLLQDIVHSMNNSYHRSIKMKPSDVNDSNVLQVYRNLYGNLLREKPIKPTLKPGHIVRITREMDKFEKSVYGGWSDEMYRVTHVVNHAIPVYRIETFEGDPITGNFYEKELLRVNV